MPDTGEIDSRHYEQFGKIVSFYADMENGLKLLLAGMLNLSISDGFALFAPYSAQKLGEVFRTVWLSKLASEPKLQAAERSLKSFSDLSTLRNNIAHDRWVQGSVHGTITPISLGVRKNALVVRESKEEFSHDRLQGAIILLSAGIAQLIAVYRDCGYDMLHNLPAKQN